MDDLISRQAVLSYIYNDLGLRDEENGKDVERQMELEDSYRYVKALPPVTPQQNHEDIAKAFQLGLAFGFGEKHDEMDKVMEEVKKAITPQKKIGRWEWLLYDGNPNIGNWHCSECRSIIIECVPKKDPSGIPLYKYCPNCGCRMVEPQESEEV